MFWTIITIWLGVGILVNICMSIDKSKAVEENRNPSELGTAGKIGVGIALTVGGLFFLWLLGCVWYFFAGGFLVFEDQPFLDKLLCGLISLFPMGVFIGFLAILNGWDPWKR